jgi:hypothetical protein
MCTYRNRTQIILLIGLVALVSAPTTATEITVINDSMTDASSVTSCTCFVPGDIPAAWLTAPVAGRIVGVQVFWKSPLGGAPDSQEAAIRIYDGSTFPTPGAMLVNDGGADAEVTTPVLSDGVLNEYRFLDQSQTIPMSVPVSAGQTFAVGLEIFNQSSGGGSFTPSATYDNNGCQSGRNGVFLFDSTTWVDACPQGVTGDWVIRAIVEPTGACCLPDDTCEDLTASQCHAAGGRAHTVDCEKLDQKGGCDPPIPATSHWGLTVLTLLLLAAGTIVALRRKPATR